MRRAAPTPDFQSRLNALSEALRLAEERATAGQLALEVMHEIRSPLEALSNLNFLTRLQSTDSVRVKEYADLAEEQIATLSQIADTTLGFARTSSSRKPIDLKTVTEAALRIHQQTIDAKRVHLVKDIPATVIARVYSSQILQLVSNLIVNALNAMPSGGKLHLRVRERRGEVQFVIADNGHGIATEHLDDVFEPFFTTDRERGTGLGLALAKRIIEGHDGKIRLRSSVRPGRSGTTFKISLPA